ncbi:MAG: hypothetical protein HYT75_07375, partial [Deltaproteobacteria bacterium]|nr:hypothetical protein [Deltaproteobacteria bacterium]
SMSPESDLIEIRKRGDGMTFKPNAGFTAFDISCDESGNRCGVDEVQKFLTAGCSPVEGGSRIVDSYTIYNTGDAYAVSPDSAEDALAVEDVGTPPAGDAPVGADHVAVDGFTSADGALEGDVGIDEYTPIDTPPAPIDSVVNQELELLEFQKKKTIAVPKDQEADCQFDLQPEAWTITALQQGESQLVGEFPASIFMSEGDDIIATVWNDSDDKYDVTMSSFTDTDDGSVMWQLTGLPYDDALLSGAYQILDGAVESAKFYIAGKWEMNSTSCNIKYEAVLVTGGMQ